MEEVLDYPPTSKLQFQEQIYSVKFSPFEWSQNLICIAFREKIVVATVKFQVSNILYSNHLLSFNYLLLKNVLLL